MIGSGGVRATVPFGAGSERRGLEPGAPQGSLDPVPSGSVVARWLRLLLLLRCPRWRLLVLTSYPEAGSGDLRRNIFFENLFFAVLSGSNLT
jgi:hypothetical protein